MDNSKFIRLKDVNFNKPESWKGKIALTFDVDWASDEVFSYTLDLIEESNFPATFFLTHDTPLLNRIRNNPSWEIALHPNFLLSANSPVGLDQHIEQILLDMKSWAPEAVSLRSHGLVTAARWLWKYQSAGIENLSMSTRFNAKNQPYEEINGLVECPIYFSENSQLVIQQEGGIELADTEQLGQVAKDELRVFDFHPIHIFLNTEDYARYENSRAYQSDWKALQSHRNERINGTENWLRSILES